MAFSLFSRGQPSARPVSRRSPAFASPAFRAFLVSIVFTRVFARTSLPTPRPAFKLVLALALKPASTAIARRFPTLNAIFSIQSAALLSFLELENAFLGVYPRIVAAARPVFCPDDADEIRLFAVLNKTAVVPASVALDGSDAGLKYVSSPLDRKFKLLLNNAKSGAPQTEPPKWRTLKSKIFFHVSELGAI